MKKIFLATNILVALALASCNNKTEQKTTETTPAMSEASAEIVNIKLSELATNKDHVCGGAEGMELTEGAVADTASYEGKVYGFCSKECKTEFVKNPSAYIAQK
jgi:YHS domain-containing protein